MMMANTFYNSHFRYHHSPFDVRDYTKYIQNHLSMAIILFPESEQKLLQNMMDGTP